MNNLAWGLQITVLGMGLVFALLAMLWGLLTLVLVLDKAPAKPDEPVSEPANATMTNTSEAAPLVNDLPADLVAAILVATLTNRSNPVSYTHLDVYKRQLQAQLGFLASGKLFQQLLVLHFGGNVNTGAQQVAGAGHPL